MIPRYMYQLPRYVSDLDNQFSAAGTLGYRITHIVDEASNRDGLDLADDITENLVDIAMVCDALLLPESQGSCNS